MIAANYQNTQQKKRLQDSYIRQLQTQADFIRMKSETNVRALPIRNGEGLLSVDEASILPRVPVKPKEFLTENDLVEEITKEIQPYVINLDQLN